MQGCKWRPRWLVHRAVLDQQRCHHAKWFVKFVAFSVSSWGSGRRGSAKVCDDSSQIFQETKTVPSISGTWRYSNLSCFESSSIGHVIQDTALYFCQARDNPSGVIISMRRCNKPLPIAILLDTRRGIQNFTCAHNRQSIRIPIRRVRVKVFTLQSRETSSVICIYIHTPPLILTTCP